jgi:hypothetical protein
MGAPAFCFGGKFNFAGMSIGDPPRVVSVRPSVSIVGQFDDHGRIPQIVGGTTPLLVDAPNAVVQISGLRFVRPVSRALNAETAQSAPSIQPMPMQARSVPRVSDASVQGPTP